MIQNSIPIGLIASPLTYVSRTISPNLFSLSFPLAILPLTFVRNSIIEFYLCHFDPTNWCDHLANQLIIFIAFTSSNEIFAHFSRLFVLLWNRIGILWFTRWLLIWLLCHCGILILQPWPFLQMIWLLLRSIWRGLLVIRWFDLWLAFLQLMIFYWGIIYFSFYLLFISRLDLHVSV